MGFLLNDTCLIVKKMNQKKVANIGLLVAIICTIILIAWYRNGESKRWLDIEPIAEEVIID